MSHEISAQEAAETLDQIAQYLEFKNENPFKVRAFLNGARILKAQTPTLNQLFDSGELAKIKGIGKGLLEKLQELLQNGKSLYLEELAADTPTGLGEILKVPGLGPKKAKILYKLLKIDTLEALEKACKENKLVALKGFGAKTQEKILKGISFRKTYSERRLYSEVIKEAQTLEGSLQKLKQVKQIALAGSLRRHLETIGDVDLVAATTDAESVMQDFVSSPLVKEIIGKGPTKSSVILKNGLHVDLRCVTPEEFPFALHHFTGSKEHNTALRTRAKAMGLKMNEYGLFKKDKLIVCKDEAEIFEKLKLHYIPPELRENYGEIEEAETADFVDLISEADLQGVFHVHTDYSDGKNTLGEMIQEAVKRDYQYIGISDHSRSAHYAGGLQPDKILRQRNEIQKLREKYPQIIIFHGIESDILKDGELDYEDKILETFDFVIASIHSRMGLDEKEMTERLVRAIKNPFTTMLGHPTGRLLLKREPYAVDMEAVIQAAIENKTIVEINANPHRFDLDWRVGRTAQKSGLLTSINPDAHSTRGFDDMNLGVGIARKAGFKKLQVFNAWSAKKIQAYLNS